MLEKEVNLNDITHNQNEDDTISSQDMVDDARARRQNKNAKFSCDNCEYSTRSVSLLKKHKNNIHKNEAQSIPNQNNQERVIRKREKCDKCNFISTSIETMDKHTKTVHKQNCDKCDFQSTSKDSLIAHTQSTHKQTCDFQPTSKDSLTTNAQSTN